MALVLHQLLQVCPKEFGDKPDKHGWSPLHILANNNDDCNVRPGMIATLCQHGVVVDCTKKRSMTPLMTAINTAHKAAADVLLMHGADPYKANSEGTTCYDMAWHNRKLRDWVSQIGVGQGTGVSGSGRFFYIDIFGEKPVVVVVAVIRVALVIIVVTLIFVVVVMAEVIVVVVVVVVVLLVLE